MPSKRKTKEEKVKSRYRLQGFRLQESERVERKEQSEFGYLSKEYVRKDLIKTVIYSVVIVGMLLLAKQYFG